MRYIKKHRIMDEFIRYFTRCWKHTKADKNEKKKVSSYGKKSRFPGPGQTAG